MSTDDTTRDLSHLPVLAQPGVKLELRPLLATLFERWREQRMAASPQEGGRKPGYKQLADEIEADTGRHLGRQSLYRAIRFRAEDEVEHAEARQPQWWVIMWLCHRLGYSVLIRPDGIRLVRSS